MQMSKRREEADELAGFAEVKRVGKRGLGARLVETKRRATAAYAGFGHLTR